MAHCCAAYVGQLYSSYAKCRASLKRFLPFLLKVHDKNMAELSAHFQFDPEPHLPPRKDLEALYSRQELDVRLYDTAGRCTAGSYFASQLRFGGA